MSGRYQKMQELLPEIEGMLTEGKSNREIAECFGLEGKRPVHDLLNRKRRKRGEPACEIPLRPKGGHKKAIAIDTAEAKDNEIKRLRMENELLWDLMCHEADTMTMSNVWTSRSVTHLLPRW